MNKFKYLSIVASSVLLFSACGSSSSDDNGGNKSSPKVVSGKVVDDPIVKAQVCYDANKNDKCDPSEKPFVTTNENGEYTLTLPVGASDGNILAESTDKTTMGGQPFTGKFSTKLAFSAKDTEVNVSPATTFAGKLVDKGLSVEKAQNIVKKATGLTDINAVEGADVENSLAGLNETLTASGGTYEQKAQEIASSDTQDQLVDEIKTKVGNTIPEKTFVVNKEATSQDFSWKDNIIYGKEGYSDTSYQRYVFKNYGNITPGSVKATIIEGENKYKHTDNGNSIQIEKKDHEAVAGKFVVKLVGTYGDDTSKAKFETTYTLNIKPMKMNFVQDDLVGNTYMMYNPDGTRPEGHMGQMDFVFSQDKISGMIPYLVEDGILKLTGDHVKKSFQLIDKETDGKVWFKDLEDGKKYYFVKKDKTPTPAEPAKFKISTTNNKTIEIPLEKLYNYGIKIDYINETNPNRIVGEFKSGAIYPFEKLEGDRAALKDMEFTITDIQDGKEGWYKLEKKDYTTSQGTTKEWVLNKVADKWQNEDASLQIKVKYGETVGFFWVEFKKAEDTTTPPAPEGVDINQAGNETGAVLKEEVSIVSNSSLSSAKYGVKLIKAEGKSTVTDAVNIFKTLGDKVTVSSIEFSVDESKYKLTYSDGERLLTDKVGNQLAPNQTVEVMVKGLYDGDKKFFGKIKVKVLAKAESTTPSTGGDVADINKAGNSAGAVLKTGDTFKVDSYSNAKYGLFLIADASNNTANEAHIFKDSIGNIDASSVTYKVIGTSANTYKVALYQGKQQLQPKSGYSLAAGEVTIEVKGTYGSDNKEFKGTYIVTLEE